MSLNRRALVQEAAHKILEATTQIATESELTLAELIGIHAEAIGLLSYSATTAERESLLASR